MTIAAENCYEILGISPDADDETVKLAYRDLAKNYHPDRNPGDEEAERQFKRINMAYEAIKDGGRRQAYNEWLAFSQKRQKSKRRQWSRLAALLALLLIGPSAVISWIAITGDSPSFEIGRRQSEVLAEKTPEQAPPTQAAPAAPSEESKTSGTAASTDNPAPAPKTAPSAIEEVRAQVEASKNIEQQVKAAAGSGSDTTNSAQDRPASPKGSVALESPQPPSPQLTSPQPASPKPALQGSASQPGQSPAAPDYTEAIAENGEQNAAPLADNTAPGARTLYPPRTERRVDGVADQPAPSQPEGARAAAQRLAELKEPGQDGIGGRGEAQPFASPSQGQPFTSSPPASYPAAPRYETSASQPFTDCERCPLMTVARQASIGDSLAISQTEVTVRQWNACVHDGVCRPYSPVSSGDPATPVTGLTERDARMYAVWLSELTGQTYSVVMPLGQPGSRASGSASNDGRCGGAQQWKPSTGDWDWLDDQPARGDCPPSASQGREKLPGFRVARRVKASG